jgi:hypothetical protein
MYIRLSNLPFGAWIKLVICIGVDLVGDSSFLFPGVGETEDIVWAPIGALILRT